MKLSELTKALQSINRKYPDFVLGEIYTGSRREGNEFRVLIKPESSCVDFPIFRVIINESGGFDIKEHFVEKGRH